MVNAIQVYLEREKTHNVRHGRQPLKDLVKGGQAVNNIEVSKETLKSIEKIAKKYKIDYAVQEANYTDPPKQLIFFRGNNVDLMEHCFKEFIHAEKDRAKNPKESIISRVEKNKELCKKMNQEHEKKRELVR